jgi:hypothetical protein
MRQTLLADGFYSAGLRVTVESPQQMSYSGIQDGNRTWGNVFKIGDRRLWVTFESIDPDLGRGTGFSHFTSRCQSLRLPGRGSGPNGTSTLSSSTRAASSRRRTKRGGVFAMPETGHRP